MAVASLVLGIIGAVFGLIPLFFILAFILGTLGLIFGFVGRGRAKNPRVKGRGMATAGIVLGVASLALGGLGVAIVNEAFEDLDDDLEAAAEGSEVDGVRSSSGNAENPPQRDVELQECSANAFGYPEAAGEILNHSSQPSDYVITVSFETPDGTKVEDGVATVQAVDPGQRARWKTIGLDVLGEVSECRVVEVERFAS